MEIDVNTCSVQASGNSLDERDAKTEFRFPQVNVASISVGKKVRYYKMDHERRGSAIIFNHEHFTVPGLKQRRGTQANCENFKLQLESLHFDVVVHNDLDYKDVRQKVIAASKEDYTKCDCFMMAVFSHGNQGILFARDVGYPTEFLWSLFAANNVPTLAGKPKLFFVQACHDEEYREVALSRIETDNSRNLYKIPTHADFLIVYSTVSGSRFIQALCHELKRNGFKEDLLTLLTFVCRRIALHYENSTQTSMHALKQMPCITSMLTRLVKFTDHK